MFRTCSTSFEPRYRFYHFRQTFTTIRWKMWSPL